jgi:hypothetical protein
MVRSEVTPSLASLCAVQRWCGTSQARLCSRTRACPRWQSPSTATCSSACPAALTLSHSHSPPVLCSSTWQGACSVHDRPHQLPGGREGVRVQSVTGTALCALSLMPLTRAHLQPLTQMLQLSDLRVIMPGQTEDVVRRGRWRCDGPQSPSRTRVQQGSLGSLPSTPPATRTSSPLLDYGTASL